jgi:photosystem II stability/assembly factor-like uncharacterized protein
VRGAAPAVLVFGCLAASAPAASANGAFPDSQTVLTPADRPQQILLVTNFGLVISEDGGQSWQWSCEREANAFGFLYQLGAPPRRRLYAVANDRLAFSDDGSCGWQTGGGAVADRVVIDFFPDPADADRVLAIAYGGGGYAVYPSGDGGATFAAPLYQAAAGDGIGGVEIARADPRIIYLAMTTIEGTRPKLARSGDAGATWTVRALEPMVGAAIARIIAVDPQDPEVVLLRLLGTDGEAIALTRDGGATVTRTLSIPGSFTSYAELPSGVRLLGAMDDANTTPALFRSRDGGATFETVPSPPRIRALAERAGVVYAATDNFGDGYALGASSDEGTTWRGVMSYGQVQAIIPCLRGDAQCRASCEALAGQGTMSPGMIWEADVCSANPPPDTMPDPLPEPPSAGGGGCGCAIARGEAGAAVVLAFVLAAGLAVRRRP